jgi:hypothetical protein
VVSRDDELDRPSQEEQAYSMHEALTDAFDEAVLRDQEAEGQPVGHLWAERGQELADVQAILFGSRETGDEAGRTLVEAARAALQRDAAALRAAARAIPSAEPFTLLGHAALANQALDSAEALADFDPEERIDQHHLNALLAGQEALRREAEGWRRLAAVATDRWRTSFERHAAESERLVSGIHAVREQLADRVNDAEPEAER